jgi:hypothetical protein
MSRVPDRVSRAALSEEEASRACREIDAQVERVREVVRQYRVLLGAYRNRR